METYKQPPKKDYVRVVPGFWRKPAIRLGFAFTIGIFAGFMIFSFMMVDSGDSSPSADDLKGTIYNSRSSDNMKTGDVIQYTSPEVTVMCNVRYSTKIIEMKVELSSKDLVKSTITFDYNNFAVLNVQNISVNDQSSAITAGNFVQLNNTGDNVFIIQLSNKNSLPNNLDFKIYQNDSPIYQNSVQVNKE